ncbi:MAG: gluconate 2-dehydrogenase subunit 3 family protein [Pseudomonadota bacterium]|nr:gluconate 2-dehydrogenase subunit 3 family protein [Pseudomonadota bacterium]
MKKYYSISRREALKRAGLILGVSIPASQMSGVLSSFALNESSYKARFFETNEFILLTDIIDQIIPKTDTAGAIDVGVHHFIDMMLNDWASKETQKHYRQGLQEISDYAKLRYKLPFSKCTRSQQLNILNNLDQSEDLEDALVDFFSDLKWFVISGYYTSEYGASVELNYDRMPGWYQGCVSFDENDRAWSS